MSVQSLPSDRCLKTLIWTNAAVVLLVLGFVGYLAKTVWLPEKHVWVVPAPDGGDLVSDEGKSVKGPVLLPEKSRLTLRKPGFSDLELSLGNPGALNGLGFVPAPKTVLVGSSPSGAAICFAGRLLGRTPCIIDSLPPGVHLLAVGGQDTRVKMVAVEVKAQAGTSVDVPLESLAGTILVSTATPGCEVAVDGIKVGRIGDENGRPVPLKLDRMAAGTYKIRASSPDGKQAKETTLTIGEQQFLQVSLGI